jgi:hypothetical protein
MYNPPDTWRIPDEDTTTKPGRKHSDRITIMIDTDAKESRNCHTVKPMCGRTGRWTILGCVDCGKEVNYQRIDYARLPSRER